MLAVKHRVHLPDRHPGRLQLIEIALVVAVAGHTGGRRHDPDVVAGALLVPYLAWVAYAATLNIAIAVRN